MNFNKNNLFILVVNFSFISITSFATENQSDQSQAENETTPVIVQPLKKLVDRAEESRKAAIAFIEDAPLYKKALSEIAKTDIEFEIPVEADIVDGVRLGLFARPKIEPSFITNQYTRIDTYQLKIPIQPGDYADLGPFAFSLVPDRKITYARQFKDQFDALDKKMKHPVKSIPRNAEMIRNKMHEYDYVSFSASLNIATGLAWSDLPLDFVLGANYLYLLNGEFQINLFRMKNDRARIRIFYHQANGYTKGFSFFLKPQLEVFGLSLLDKQINRWLKLDLSSKAWNKMNHNVLLFDYVINLNDPSACDAFDQFMNRGSKLKLSSRSLPNRDTEKLYGKVLSDITQLELLAAQDANKPFAEKRVHRVFKGSDSNYIENEPWSIGNSFAKWSADKIYAHHNIKSYQSDESLRYYLYDSYNNRRMTRLLFGRFRDENVFGIGALFNTDENFKADNQGELNFTYDRTDKYYRMSEQAEVLNLIFDTLPREIASQIDLKDYYGYRNLENATVYMQVIFFPQIYATIPDISATTIQSKINEYQVAKKLKFNRSENKEIEKIILPQLEIIFNSSKTTNERIDALMSLRNSILFHRIGLGVLLHLMPIEQLENVISVDLMMSSSTTTPISFHFGKSPNREIYRTITYVDNLINNRSIDLRLEAELNDAENKIQYNPDLFLKTDDEKCRKFSIFGKCSAF